MHTNPPNNEVVTSNPLLSPPSQLRRLMHNSGAPSATPCVNPTLQDLQLAHQNARNETLRLTNIITSLQKTKAPAHKIRSAQAALIQAYTRRKIAHTNLLNASLVALW